MSDHSDNQLQANLNPSNLNNQNTSTNRKFQPIPPFVSLLIINALYLAYPISTIAAIIFVIEASSVTSTKTSEIQETSGDSTSITVNSIVKFSVSQISAFLNLFWLEKIVIFGVISVTNLINTGFLNGFQAWGWLYSSCMTHTRAYA